MATIRKRGDKWQAQVRKTGAKTLSKSFFNKRDAERWAREREAAIDLGQPDLYEDRHLTLGDVLVRYQAEITPAKKGRDAENRRLNRLRNDDIARVSIASLDGPTLCQFRDRRLNDGKRACQYDLVLIRHALEIGRKEWALPIRTNPVDEIRVPNGIRARHRRLLPDEFDRLKQAAPLTRNPLTLPAVELAIETAMRRSELLKLRWGDVDVAARLAHLDDTKNGQPRSVPLTDRALSILETLPRVSDRVLPITEVALRQSWERLVARAGIEDLHFHDLRHEAISRFFERGLTIPEVALISGHKDPRMLFRYTHLKPENVVAKLNALEAA